mgnify:CR=1 FL=1
MCIPHCLCQLPPGSRLERQKNVQIEKSRKATHPSSGQLVSGTLQDRNRTAVILYPVLGPHIYYPESLDAARESVGLAEGMRLDYLAARAGGPLSGYGYFIAIPSLHVMLAMYCQAALFPYRALFNVFFPINVLVIASTFLLGYHYVLDIVPSIVIMMICITRWNNPRRAAPLGG